MCLKLRGDVGFNEVEEKWVFNSRRRVFRLGFREVGSEVWAFAWGLATGRGSGGSSESTRVCSELAGVCWAGLLSPETSAGGIVSLASWNLSLESSFVDTSNM